MFRLPTHLLVSLKVSYQEGIRKFGSVGLPVGGRGGRHRGGGGNRVRGDGGHRAIMEDVEVMLVLLKPTT